MVLARAMRVRTVDASLSGQGGFVSARARARVCVTHAQASAVSRCTCTHPASDITSNSQDANEGKKTANFNFNTIPEASSVQFIVKSSRTVNVLLLLTFDD